MSTDFGGAGGVLGPEAGRMAGTTDARDPVLDRVVGRWTGQGGDVVIEAPGGRERLIMRGRHADWEGSCAPGLEEDVSVVKLSRVPTAAEMSAEAPQWAREVVQGQIRWELELEARRECTELVLKGNWFPGELRWHSPPAHAEVSGRGTPRELRYFRDASAVPEWPVEPRGEPFMTLRSAEGADGPLTLPTLFKDEPFFIELRVPRDFGVAGAVTVTVRSQTTGSAGKVVLTPDLSPAQGFYVFYTSREPTVLDPLGVCDRRLISLEEAGDMVEFSWQGVTTTTRVFGSPVQQGIFECKVRLDQYKAANETLLLAAPLAAADREEVHLKLRAIANADTVLARKDLFEDYRRLAIARAYVRLLGAWKQFSQAGTEWMDWRGPSGELDANLGVVWTYPAEQHAVQNAIDEGKEAYANRLFALVTELTIGTYQFVVSTTGADQFVAMAFGIDSMGNAVDSTDRVLAGLSLASQLLLMTAAPARRFEAQMEEISARRGFEQVLAEQSREYQAPGLNVSVVRGAGTASIRRSDGVALQRWDTAAGTVWKPYIHEAAVAGKFGAPGDARRIGASPTTELQRFDDTCGLCVARGMVREGMPGIRLGEEAKSIAVATDYGRKWYEPGMGMNDWGIARFVKVNRGRAVAASEYAALKGTVPPPLTALEIKRQLDKGRQVAVLIRSGPGGFHWVRVEGLLDQAGEKWVQIGDPWNGSSWQVRCRVFEEQIKTDSLNIGGVETPAPAGKMTSEWVIARW